MTVSEYPGFRFSDLDDEEQSILSAMKQSQVCLDRWELTEGQKAFHLSMISACAAELRKIWFPYS